MLNTQHISLPTLALALALAAGLFGPAVTRADEAPERLLPLAPPSERVTVTVHKLTETKSAKILLSEIARVETQSQQLARQLDKIELGELPEIERTFRLRPEWLKSRLRLAGVDVQQLRLECPAAAAVKRVGQRLPEDEVRAAVEKALLKRLGVATDAAVVFQDFRILTPPPVPYGERQYAVEIRLNSKRLGHTQFYIDIEVDGQRAARLSATAKVDLRVPAARLKRKVQRGATLTAADLVIQPALFSQLPRGAVLNAASLVGTTARAALAPGQYVRESDVAALLLVKRNQPTMMVLNKGALKITAKGVALQDASLGQMVQVRNLSSDKTITARVAGKQLVEVIN